MNKGTLLLICGIFLSQNLLAVTVCETQQGKVVLNENYTLKVTGLSAQGIANGSYRCTVVGAGPGLLSMQRQVSCSKKDNTGLVIQGWMIEGYDLYGHQAASFSLYNRDGLKVFEAGCARK